MAEADNAEPRRGLLSRLGRRTTSPPEAATSTPAAAPAEDEGWVQHEPGDGSGFEGWLYHYADGAIVSEDGTVYERLGAGPLTEAPAQPDPEPEPEPEPEPTTIPRFVEYSRSDLPNYALGAVLVVAAVAAVITLFLVTPDPSAGGFVLVACLAVIAAAAGWGLANWSPTVVSVRDGILEVARGNDVDEFDLRDPQTRVELGAQPGARSWQTTVANPGGKKVTVGARHVKAQHFTEIVEHHRNRLKVDGRGDQGDGA
ncbi:MAG: hypothetical protein JWR90_1523 [Marmoricola sp.]|nr:hypothetical protein [Marmoricola sp.]